MTALALAYPWVVSRRYLPQIEEPSPADAQAWYERRYRRNLPLRFAPALLFAYFLGRALTATGEMVSFRRTVAPGLVAFVGLYLLSALGALVWRYRYDRAFARARPEFAGSVQPLTLRLMGFGVVTVSLSLLGSALLPSDGTLRWALIGAGFLTFLLGQRVLLAAIVRSRVAVPLDSPTGRCLAETIERFGFKPKQIVLVPNLVANAFALQNGTVMITTALRVLSTDDEIAAVAAHELSHARDRDAVSIQRWRMLAFLLLVASVAGVAFGLAVHDCPPLFLLPVCLCLAMLVSQLTGVLMTRMTRRMEFKCDADVAKVGLGEPLRSGLTKIHRHIGLPDRWIGLDRVMLTHPSLNDRLAALGLR